MGFLTKIFGGKKNEVENIQYKEGDRNPRHKKKLKSEFGLEYAKQGWVFEGGQFVDDEEMVTQLTTPSACWHMAKNFAEKSNITHMCIVGGNQMTLLVFNRQPTPICFKTTLDVSGTSDLIYTVIKERGEQVLIYNSTWLVPLK